MRALIKKEVILHELSHRFARGAHHLRQRVRKSFSRALKLFQRSFREVKLLRKKFHRTRSYRRRHHLLKQLHHKLRMLPELLFKKDLILSHRFAHSAHQLHYRTFGVGQHPVVYSRRQHNYPVV